MNIKNTPRAERETAAWRIVVIYGLDGYNPEQIRQMTGISTRQIMAMSKTKKELLDTGKDPREFETWLSVIEHQKAEKAAKADAAARSMPRVTCAQTFAANGKPTLWAIQNAPAALKDDPRVPRRVVLQYHRSGHDFAGAERWGREQLAPYREKYQRVLDGTSKGFTGPVDPLTPQPPTDQQLWQAFREGKTFSEVVRINCAVDQLRAREVQRVYDAFIEAERGFSDDPCHVSNKDSYEMVAAWLVDRPARLKARRATQAAKAAEEKAKRVPQLPTGITPEDGKQELDSALSTSADNSEASEQWPEGFGGDDLRKKTDALGDDLAITDEADQ